MRLMTCSLISTLARNEITKGKLKISRGHFIKLIDNYLIAKQELAPRDRKF